MNKSINIQTTNRRIMIVENFLDEVQIQWLKDNYSELGGIQCAKKLDIKPHYIYKIAKAYQLNVSELTKSKQSKIKGIKRGELIHSKRVEKSKRITISTPEVSYCLGFLWGDGYLRKMNNLFYPCLEIKDSDFKSIFPFLKSMGEWSTSHRKRGNRKSQCYGTLCDGIWGHFLYQHEYKMKSLNAPTSILSDIPEELKPYWWRGYSDADGCFYVKPKPHYLYQFSIAGTYDQDWKELESLLGSLSIKYTIKKRVQNKNSKSSTVRLTSKECVTKWGNYIYDDINIGLERKKVIWESIK
jgi:hypothetical protein